MKVVTRELTYLGSRARMTEHREAGPLGPRVIFMEWLDDADERNGGYPAGTITRIKVKGDGRKPTFKVLEARTIVESIPEAVT